MNRLNKIIFFFLFGLSSVAGFGQSPDSVSVSLPPVVDYNSPKQYVIKDIRVTGITLMNPELLIQTIGLVRGDRIYIPGDYISEALRKLWSQRYYSDARAEVEIEGDSVIIDIFVQERPRVLNWTIEGVKTGEANTLLKDKLKLRRGGELSDFTIQTAVEVIKQFYHEKGFLNTEVEIRQSNDPKLQNMVNVAFVVHKGSKVKIGEIVFDGNKLMAGKKLRRAMKKTHQKSINFIRSAKFDQKKYEEDKELLIEYYQSKGYRNARILSDSIYPIGKKRIGIRLNVEEGDKFYYRNINWIGNTVYTTEMLSQLLGIEKGDTYNRKGMLDRLGLSGEGMQDDYAINSLYQNQGYLFSQIEPVETVIEGDSIDMEIRIVEGKQATVNEVLITGNTRTNERVVRRELYTRPAELYNRSLLINSMRLLANMQHFEENILPDVQPISNELVNVAFPLKEKPSDQFEVSGGWGGNMFVGSLGVTFNNVSLRRAFEKGAWRPYPSGDNQSLSLRAQTNGKYYKAFSASFTEPWLGGKRPTSLSASIYYSAENNANFLWQTGTKRFVTLGTSVGIGKRLNWPDPYFTMYGELSYQMYSLNDWDSFILRNGTANIIALKLAMERSSVDQPIYSRRGSGFSLSVTATPPYSLFSNRDFSRSMKDSERYKFIEYHKWKMSYMWYHPLLKNEKLVVMTRAEGGYLGHYNQYRKSPFEGFSMGGDGVSGYNVYGVENIGLRGYEENALTPRANYGIFANAYAKYTAELRYPIIMQPATTVYGLVFAEAGNAFYNWTDINPFVVKRSAGFGVRIFLPMIGLMGIDWGYGFDKPVGGNKASGGQIHFMIGGKF